MKYPLTPHIGNIANKHHTLGINNALTNDNTTVLTPNPKTFQNDAYLHQCINLAFFILYIFIIL